MLVPLSTKATSSPDPSCRAVTLAISEPAIDPWPRMSLAASSSASVEYCIAAVETSTPDAPASVTTDGTVPCHQMTADCVSFFHSTAL